ncbi:MAG: hypothetical protein ACYTAF_11520 [Planctomycetota bacterium]
MTSGGRSAMPVWSKSSLRSTSWATATFTVVVNSLPVSTRPVVCSARIDSW